MAKLMVHRNVLKRFPKLPGKVQKRISDLIEEFQEDPNADSIGMHPLKAEMRDPKVRGVTKLPDGYRAIVIAPERGDTYLLVHVDAHDKAYKWAKNKTFEVHKMTGVFQVFDTQEVELAQQAAASPVVVQPKPTYVLAKLDDEDLFQAGVPRPLIPAVKSINCDAQLESLAEYLPPDCRDVLYGLAAGLTLDAAIAEMLGKPAVAADHPGPGDFTRIHEHANFDLVLVEDSAELKEILRGSIEEWRIFLHPYQRQLVEWNVGGPMNITGAAGTGKTVALMHRAVHLAKNLSTPKQRILFTTFTTNLSVTIKHNVARLAPEYVDQIEVSNLHALARTICSRSGWKGRIADEEELDKAWGDVWMNYTVELPLPKHELRKEYELVIDPNGVDDEEAYLSTVRSGRPRLTRQERRNGWPVFRAFQRALKKRNLLTFEGAVHQARLSVESGNFTKYAHVLVDEAQDFSLEALRLIKAISPVEENAANSLTLAGDGHQRIYRTRIPMSRAGINIRGRSRRLKINYRTSEQIRQFAQGILTGVDVDDLNGDSTTTSGDHSVFHGPEPIVQAFADEQAEAEGIVKWVNTLCNSHGLATHEICITPRKPAIVSALAAAQIPTFELKPREEDPGEHESGVRLGTMKRIKGLEFRAVIMACARPDDSMNDPSRADIRSRCERYVAATRAQRFLCVARSNSQGET